MSSRKHEIGIIVIKDSWCYIRDVNDMKVSSFKPLYYIKSIVVFGILKNKCYRFAMRGSSKARGMHFVFDLFYNIVQYRSCIGHL